ncbi:MAG: DEAD/DEAH box helicase, partial [Gemmatimonadota bacterium]
MDTFEDLGIAPELAAAAESLGWDAPRGLQRDALPVIRRGNNVVLHASAGSGAAGAYGLGLLDRLLSDPAPDDAGPLALVLVPDSASASRTAASLARLAAPAGLPVRALAPGWPVRQAHVLVASPTAAMEAVRGSRLKLEGLRALVVDAADQMDALGQWEEIETLVDIVPSDAQRVVTAGTLGDRVDGFIDRHARRAMTIPPRSDDHEDPSADAPTVGYAVVPEHDKAVALVPLLQAAEADEVAVVCRTHARADDLRSALEARGAAGDLEDRRVLVLPLVEADQRTTRAHVISADVPFDAGALAELHGRGGDVLVTPRERAHLLRIARQAGIRARPLPDADARGTEPAEVIRERIRTLLASADLSDHRRRHRGGHHRRGRRTGGPGGQDRDPGVTHDRGGGHRSGGPGDPVPQRPHSQGSKPPGRLRSQELRRERQGRTRGRKATRYDRTPGWGRTGRLAGQAPRRSSLPMTGIDRGP